MDEIALQELSAEAAADTVADAAAENEAAGVVAIDPAGEWAAMLKVGVLILSPVMPFIATIYTEEAIGQVSAAIVPVAEKYDVSAGGLFGKYGPEIGLALVAGPLIVRTVLEYRAMRGGAVQVPAQEAEIREEAREDPAAAA